MLRRWRRRRGLAKVEAGDGRALPPYRFWQPFSRSLFYLDLADGEDGHFTNPIQLPGWASVTLLIAGLVAGLERALTLRNHWLLDAETFWLG